MSFPCRRGRTRVSPLPDETIYATYRPGKKKVYKAANPVIFVIRLLPITCHLPSICLAILFVGLTHCGYTLVGAQVEETGTRFAVAVPPVHNQSREPGLAPPLTAALRRAIVHSAVLSLVSERNAPRRLQSVVRQFRIVPTSFDARDNVVQYRIEAETLIRLVDRASGAPVLEQEIAVDAEYLVSTTGIVRQNVVAREAAIFRLAQRFAEKCTALIEVTLL